MLTSLKTHASPLRMAVALSSISVLFGVCREFLIVGLLGFTSQNDRLQLYLSIFYTIGLSIDAVRLSCLNLFQVMSITRILFSASIIGFPFAMLVGLVMSYTTGGLNHTLLWMSIVASYLNLMAALLIVYLQRHHFFLTAQMINVMPNIILIPGMIMCYWYLHANLIFAMVCLVSAIPVVQCLLLLAVVCLSQSATPCGNMSFFASLRVFVRHFAAQSGEQLFQIVARSVFYKYGTGYLSVYAIMIRIYAAVRFILIDSFIGSKLANWHIDKESNLFLKMVNSIVFAVMMVAFSLIISLKPHADLVFASIQMMVVLCFGFYFSTIVRIIYFKINRHESNPSLIVKFASFEMVCALSAIVMATQFNYPVLAILWLGYIAKPFAQLLLLRKRYLELAAS